MAASSTERVSGPATPAQRRHLVANQRFVRRVLDQQLRQLADQVGVLTEFQFAPDPLDHGGPSFLLERVAHPGGPVAADAGQRLAPPQRVRLPQQFGGRLVVTAGGQGVGLPAQPAELVHVNGLGIDLEQIALSPSQQPQVVADGLAERGPEPGHVDRKALAGLGWRLGVPQPVDQGLGRHQRPRREQEHGQDGTSPGPPKILPPPGGPELNRPEDPKFHDRSASFTARRQGS